MKWSAVALFVSLAACGEGIPANDASELPKFPVLDDCPAATVSEFILNARAVDHRKPFPTPSRAQAKCAVESGAFKRCDYVFLGPGTVARSELIHELESLIEGARTKSSDTNCQALNITFENSE